MNADAIRDAVMGVTGKWAKQRRAEEREASRASRRRQAWVRSDRVTLKDAAGQIMERAYLKASANDTLPAHARQLMYAARPYIQEQTGEKLDDQYFCQTLLPDYMRDNPKQTAEWDVVFDARGNLTEPHTKKRVPLGTLNVRDYLARIGTGDAAHDDEIESISSDVPTIGPTHRYGAILFIEKEGFTPLLEHVKLGQRYDVAIMSTKGMSVTASRQLIDTLCAAHSVPLLVLRDFDKAGFSIVATLRRDTRRYSFTNPVNVIDLGLRLADVREHDLPAEDVSYGKSNPRPNLRKNGATEDEVEFLCSASDWRYYRGQRVELNTFASDELVAWIERKLQANGVRKIVPDAETLALAYRRAARIRHINKGIERLSKAALRVGERTAVPVGLRDKVLARLEADPAQSWDEAIAALVEQTPGEGGTQ